MPAKPGFIVFEGIDGSGKSTQINMLKKRMGEAGIQAHFTMEPTDMPTGRLIRDVLGHQIKVSEATLAALFLADRINHIEHQAEGLLKWLSEGYHVISDRYYLSSYAYHSVHLPMDWVIEINRYCANKLKPLVTFFLDIPVEVALSRLNKKSSQREYFETGEKLRLISARYHEAINRVKDDENIIILDGNGNPAQLHAQIWQILTPIFYGKSFEKAERFSS